VLRSAPAFRMALICSIWASENFRGVFPLCLVNKFFNRRLPSLERLAIGPLLSHDGKGQVSKRRLTEFRQAHRKVAVQPLLLLLGIKRNPSLTEGHFQNRPDQVWIPVWVLKAFRGEIGNRKRESSRQEHWKEPITMEAMGIVCGEESTKDQFPIVRDSQNWKVNSAHGSISFKAMATETSQVWVGSFISLLYLNPPTARRRRARGLRVRLGSSVVGESRMPATVPGGSGGGMS